MTRRTAEQAQPAHESTPDRVARLLIEHGQPPAEWHEYYDGVVARAAAARQAGAPAPGKRGAS